MINLVKYLPLAFLSLYLSKILVVGANFTDAPIILIIASLSAYYEYGLKNKELKKLQEDLSVLSAELDKNKKDVEDVRSYVGQIKFATQIKTGLGNVNR